MCLCKQHVQLRVNTDVLYANDASFRRFRFFPNNRQSANPHQMFVVFCGGASSSCQLKVAHHVDVDVLFDRELTGSCRYLKSVIFNKLTFEDGVQRLTFSIRSSICGLSALKTVASPKILSPALTTNASPFRTALTSRPKPSGWLSDHR